MLPWKNRLQVDCEGRVLGFGAVCIEKSGFAERNMLFSDAQKAIRAAYGVRVLWIVVP